MFAQCKADDDLKNPLKTRGRPKVLRISTLTKRRQAQGAYQHSNLSILHQEDKITTDQYNAAETYLWILREVKKILPLPKIAQNKYQERIKLTFYEMGLINENYARKMFHRWRQSIERIHRISPLSKELLERFLWNEQYPLQRLTPVELQLIKRGLDALAHLYQKKI